MSIKIENLDDRSRLILTGEVSIYSAGRLIGQLLDFVDKGQALEIDLAEVSDLDCAGLQLLAFVKREAGAANKLISFINHSDAVLKVLNLCNLDEAFETATIT